jgi:meso-butanediol dehydrogenase/(S,S)-butanediol dehydrogenase/diacetyl reductase
MRHSPLQGLTAFVSGGGSGIGEASAKAFAANGGAVVVADLRPDQAERVATDIVKAGGRAIWVGMDVSKPHDIELAVAKAIIRFDALDVLINTAALVRPAPLDDAPLDVWRRCFDVNVDGALLLARACLPHLKKSSAASVVHVGSLAGKHGYPMGGAYGTSKAALMTLSRQMALEWAQYGVRVNVVVPGTIDTPMARGTVQPAMLAERAKTIPMRRLGQPEEVANLIAFLASPAASYITAETFNCDGGLSQSLFSQPMGVNQREELPA